MGRVRVENITANVRGLVRQHLKVWSASFGVLKLVLPASVLALDESGKALGPKDAAGESEQLERPPDKISRTKARRRASSLYQQVQWGSNHGNAGRHGLLLRQDSRQLRFTSTSQDASAGQRTSSGVATEQVTELRGWESDHLRRNGGKEGGSKHSKPASKKIPPKSFGAARLVWSIHDVLGSMPWGPATETALEELAVQLRNHHVSEVLRGLRDPEQARRFFEWCKNRDGYAHDALNYNMMVAKLAATDRASGPVVMSLIAEMCERGLELYTNTLVTLVLSYHRGNRIREAVHVFAELRSRGKPPAVGAYACLIDVLAQTGNFRLAGEVYFTVRELALDLDLDARAYTHLLRAFGRARDVDMVCSLFQEMAESSRCAPNTYAYGSLVRALAAAGRMDEAMARFREMTGAGFAPDLPTYNAVIDALGKASRTAEACNVLSEMVDRGLAPDVVTYNSLLHALGTTERVDHVRALYKEMQASGVAPDEFTCSILVQALGRCGKLEVAVELFLDMIKTPGMRLDVVMYNTMLNRLGKAGRVEQVGRLFKEMKASGQQPDMVSYNIVVDALCRAEDFPAANNVLVEMKAAGFPPNVVTYNNLMHSFGKAGKVARASRLFQQMGRDRVAPDQISHNIMINVLGKAGKTTEALSVLKDMRDRGVSPDVVTYNRLIDAFGAAGEPKAALLLYREMLENDITPDRITFTVLINRLANNRRIETALTLYREMRDRGLRPDVVTYNCLMTGYIKEGRVAEANELLIRMKGSKVKPSVTTYGILIDANARYNMNEMAYKLRQERNDAGFLPEWAKPM